MKAKEYAKRLQETEKETNLDNAIKELVEGFVYEIKELIRVRNPQSIEGLAGVYTTLDQKWRAVANLVQSIAPEGFRLVCFEAWPDMMYMSKSYNKGVDSISHTCRTLSAACKWEVPETVLKDWENWGNNNAET
jgi:hypothetical protein